MNAKDYEHTIKNIALSTKRINSLCSQVLDEIEFLGASIDDLYNKTNSLIKNQGDRPEVQDERGAPLESEG